MATTSVFPEAVPPPRSCFVTTHWSVVVGAQGKDSPHSAAALEKLCRGYWYPLYAHVRRLGHNPHDAEDLTQEFFARLLQKGYLDAADQAKGRFRGSDVVRPVPGEQTRSRVLETTPLSSVNSVPPPSGVQTMLRAPQTPLAAEVTRLRLQLRQAEEEVARIEAQRASPESGSKTNPLGP